MSVFKRVFCVLCVAVLICFSGVTAYASSYIYKETYKINCSANQDFWFSGQWQDESSRFNIHLYAPGDGNLWLVSNTGGRTDWNVSGFYGSYKTFFNSGASVLIDGSYTGYPISEGSSWGGFDSWGVDSFYDSALSFVEAGSNPQVLYYTSLDTMEAGSGSDFFQYIPIYLRQTVRENREIVSEMVRKAVLIAVPCGVGLIALLIGLKKLKMLFLTFQC